MTNLVERLRAAIDETEAWARAASQTYRFADEGSKVPDGGVHWQWVTGEDWTPVTPDPVTMELLEGADGSWHANLATVEEWPSTMRIDEERTRTTMMPRTYANAIDEMDPAAAGHIIRHDPATVLRRCAADRKILDLWDANERELAANSAEFSRPAYPMEDEAERYRRLGNAKAQGWELQGRRWALRLALAGLAEAYGVEA